MAVQNIIIIFSLTGWCGVYNITRLRIITLREETFVESCIAYDYSKLRIMFRHLLPNTIGFIICNIAMGVAGFILGEAGLSFLGLGVPLDTATWGTILNSARNWTVFLQRPLLWVVPGLVVGLFVCGINFVGNGLRDAFDSRI